MSPPAGGNSPSFSWSDWRNGPLPSLADHSGKKLELLRDYIVLYLQIVCQNVRGKDLQPINFVDGFAGGGLYADNKPGSPLILLDAVREAEALINLDRTKKISIAPTFYFIEENKNAFECLRFTLESRGYASEFGRSIILIQGDFTKHAATVVDDICRRHPRGGGRTIFFLDQCGYIDVSPKLIGALHTRLSQKSEFIINFAIDWLSDFLSSNSSYEKILRKLDIEHHVSLPELLKLKETLPGWRYVVEAKIGEGLRRAIGMPFFSPFYIEPEDNHRGYWLLHLAPVARARAAMIEIHWRTANRSKHYGSRGLEILAYKPDSDPSLYLDGMSFNDTTRKECANLLVDDLARTVRDEFPDGLSVKELEEYCTNRTIADPDMLSNAIWSLFDQNALQIRSPSGQEKRARSLAPEDRIRPERQIQLFDMSATTGKSP